MSNERDRALQAVASKWRGFNLFEYFWAAGTPVDKRPVISEEDCAWMRDWGFNYVRLPMDYRYWIDSDWRKNGRITSPDEVFKIKTSILELIAQSVQIANSHGLHVTLNFHRGPGYCIGENFKNEPFDLWKDPIADEAFSFHWKTFADYFKGVSVKDLSFNLLNEPSAIAPDSNGYMPAECHARVMKHAIEAIREVTPDRIIITDAVWYGKRVCEELKGMGVIQSGRAYEPNKISHYRVSFVDKNSDFPEPTWPYCDEDGTVKWDRKYMEAYYADWGELTSGGEAGMIGEGGGFSTIPHKVLLAWFGDVMDITKGHGLGYANWGLRGGMGVIDTGRDDVEYEEWYGHKLDRQLLELMKA